MSFVGRSTRRSLATRGPRLSLTAKPAPYPSTEQCRSGQVYSSPAQHNAHRTQLAAYMKAEQAKQAPASHGVQGLNHGDLIDFDSEPFSDDTPWLGSTHDDGAWQDQEDNNVQTVAERDDEILFYTAQLSIKATPTREYRQRREKLLVDEARWAAQMEEMSIAFMDYQFRRKTGTDYEGETVDFERVKSIDIFGIHYDYIGKYDTDKYRSASLIRQGYFPCNPLIHSSMISVRTLELFHHLFVRCPRMSIQPFIRSLCDFHGNPFANYLCVQFSSAYDIFIALTKLNRAKVRQVLGCDHRDWRALNSCPPCQYLVRDEDELPISIMVAGDGGNTLKRSERREAAPDSETLGRLQERPDNRDGRADYYISNEDVDRWDEKNWCQHPNYNPERAKNVSGSTCEDRWENMKDRHTAVEFGRFKETGVFIMVCRHRFLLWIMDMVRSGEQRKYGLTILKRFLLAIREERARLGLPKSKGSIGFGYNIGCQFKGTVQKSPLAELAEEENLQILIGILHGYTHNRLCQLENLMTYVAGAGLEDLESCELSQSNT